MKKSSETKVNVGTLKARLAEFLRIVRSGTELVILDRQTPIARVVPFSVGVGLQVYQARRPFREVSPIRGKAARLEEGGSLSLLRDERGGR